MPHTTNAQERLSPDRDLVEEKIPAEHVESAADKEQQGGAKADYSGFTQKTDPVEIRLVRKLDLYIMVC